MLTWEPNLRADLSLGVTRRERPGFEFLRTSVGTNSASSAARWPTATGASSAMECTGVDEWGKAEPSRRKGTSTSLLAHGRN